MWPRSLQLGSFRLKYVCNMSICFELLFCVAGGLMGNLSYWESKSSQWVFKLWGETHRGKRWMQFSSPRPRVINYPAIDPWVSEILSGPPPHIHQALSLQLSLSGNASNTHSSPEAQKHGLLLRYNTDLYLYEERIEPGGLHYAPRCLNIFGSVLHRHLLYCTCKTDWTTPAEWWCKKKEKKKPPACLILWDSKSNSA